MDMLDQPHASIYQLTKIQTEYAYWVAIGLTPRHALRRTPFIGSPGEFEQKLASLLAHPGVREAIEIQKDKLRIRYEIDQDHVIEGLMEAVNVAREQSDARSMIMGWSEVAKVKGLAAPTRSEIDVHIGTTSEELAQASEAQLLKLLEKQRALEGDFEVKDDG